MSKSIKFERQIAKIIENKTHCYFISPHMDDAALSAGGLINHLSKKVPVTVINVFTEVHGDKPTMSAKAFLKQSEVKSAKELFYNRQKEDRGLFKKIGVKVINLGFIDVIWRKKKTDNKFRLLLGKIIPEFVHLYPTYRFHAWTGKVSKEERELKINLKEKLQMLINDPKKSVIFCPVGIGNYVDHIVVRDVTKYSFKDVIYWSDFNYSVDFHKENKFIGKNKLDLVFFDKENKSKKKLIEGYKSQIYAIFPHGKVPDLPDFYYV